jgi:hypothetical protein
MATGYKIYVDCIEIAVLDLLPLDFKTEVNLN